MKSNELEDATIKALTEGLHISKSKKIENENITENKLIENISLDDIKDKAYELGYEVLDDEEDDKTILVYNRESTEEDNFDDFDNNELYVYLDTIPAIRYQIDNRDNSCLAIWLKELNENETLKNEDIDDIDKSKYPEPTGDIEEYSLQNNSDNPIWITGYIVYNGKVYNVGGKVFLEGSEFGIDNGPISKFYISDRDTKDTIINYDRGWDIEPTDDNREMYEAVKQLLIDYREKNPYEVDE